MNDKMVKFLKSIHIVNIDSFDIDFEMVGWNRFNKKQLDMVIVKKTPWDYPLLREFQDGLSFIEYEYSLRFSYLNRPTGEQAITLFYDWYQTLYRLPYQGKIKSEKDELIYFLYENEDSKNSNQQMINDFKDFLRFLSYEFVVKALVEEPVQEVVEEVVDSPIAEDNLSAAEKIAEEAIEESKNEAPINDRNDLPAVNNASQNETTAQAEAALLALMRANYKEMQKERERQRLSRRGNYQHVEFIDAIDSNSGSVDFDGEVFYLEVKEFAGRKSLNIGVADDNGGAIFVNMKQNDAINDDFVAHLKGSKVRIRGVVYMDEYSKSVTVRGHYIDLLPPDEIAKEPYEKNRVELHLHSMMSTQDAVTSMMDYCNYAKALGHTAMAITDHGCVQGFPDAQAASKKTGVKLLYGCEFYMVDDKLNYIKNPCDIPLNKATYVVLDLETTGLSARYNKIIEFGAVKIEKGTEIGRIDILIDPEKPLPEKIARITNITDAMLKGKPTIKEALPKIINFIGDSILVTHNADFDFSFIQQALIDNGFEPLKNAVIDTLSLSRYLFPESRNHNLGSLCRNMEINYDSESAHRADYDASVLNDVWQPMIVKLTKDNYGLTHADLGKLQTPTELYKHMRPLHVIVLAKNKAGLKDLYKLVSISNIEYLSDLPKITRSILNEHRENLIFGSACLNGEVFRTAQYYNKEALKEVIKFYDYIEVQPPENYSFLVNMQDLEENDVLQYIKDIYECAKEVNKPVCATGDVHYLSPKQKVFRDVYIFAPGVGKTAHPLNPYGRKNVPHFENPDQHYRSTKEMLDAFSFLGEDIAKEIVIDNTNLIADQIESILPVPNDKLYTPTIENCEQNLKDMCYNKAHELYGDQLPELIEKRLEAELNGIISNGYSVIYYIAHKIIKKANEDGFIVGSRGSVGSSFVATMSDITEVNPLPPHYRCPKCKHLEWTKETMPDIRSGYDLPNKKCPICGEEMVHDGQDIPFETFLGFNADKTPDIDLNFPRDYQSKAHDYTKVLLGENNVFRAGTIETVAEKTAFGFARGFLERSGISLDSYPKAKIQYLACGCTDVKRTTGQHPGGIVVVPSDHDVYDFTPIQWPADEVSSTWKTTHFDFHSIHDTILKLDLLGHVDPMALKMMCDLTHINIKDIPMNDPKVLELFSSNKPLKLKRNYLQQKTGALAIPEFGTDFVRGILEKAQPKSFTDLVIISGLSHGTGVWNGNADKLIDDKIATLREVIGCRDDIMTYLIGMGLPSKASFSIMEDVRKGRGLKPEYVEIMKANNVPEYYIGSCNKIKYMFPKGHAVAYVTMAIRVGYFKIYYPLEFYATFFSVRSKQYDIHTMIKGEDAIIARIEELKARSSSKFDKLSPKEEEQLKTLQIAIEMVQRGYSFANLDLYKSDAVNFVIDHENKALIPPFTTLDGLGESAAQTVVDERAKGEFTSKEDLLRRTKLSSTNVNDLAELGVLDGLNENDQLSLFDFSW